VSDRVPNPPPSPVITRLLKEGSETDTEDVMALVGYVGPGRNDDIRLYSDIDFQRWMDIAPDEIVDSSPLDAFSSGRKGRTVIWVKREAMEKPVFKEDSLEDFRDDFAGSWMSTWPLIPATRYVAAQILDLLPQLSHGEGGQMR
jgi:hypothetical protein